MSVDRASCSLSSLSEGPISTSSQQRSVEWLIKQCDEAGDLWKTNPALVSCLLEQINHKPSEEFSGLETLKTIFRYKQRHLCGMVGLPCTEATVKIIRKLKAECCTEHALSDLRELLIKGDAHKYLRHLHRLTPTVLAILRSPELRRFITHSLLSEILRNKDFDQKSYPLDELHEYSSKHRSLDTTTTFRSLDELHQHLNQENRKFPPPPVVLPTNFKPITSYLDLVIEGAVQNHCIDVYWKDVVLSRCYVYKMESPERATILLCKKHGRWILKEIALAGNRKAHWANEDYVREVVTACQCQRALHIPIPELDYLSWTNFPQAVFPPPPLALPDNFEPLSSPLLLGQCGKIPRQRMPEFLDLIQKGKMYAYRLVEPFEVTVILQNQDQGANLFYDGVMITDSKEYWEVGDTIFSGDSLTWEAYQYIQDVVESCQGRFSPQAWEDRDDRRSGKSFGDIPKVHDAPKKIPPYSV